jgi:transcriptional regulator with GAF, ATPase, and Fis domain
MITNLDTRMMLQLKSAAMHSVYAKVKAVADTRTTVLLVGETGTGKGVMARLLHEMSPRRSGPFISLHCSAVPDSLLESELFGHERGAFTGAYKRHIGKFELARQGSLFLDEIGTISLASQTKLLKVLQDRTFQRIGGERELDVEARIIAATNHDLMDLCSRGFFRQDLFYRLNVFPIHLPPLRERREDIMALADHFLGQLNSMYGKGIVQLHPRVVAALLSHHWPGNIRELENLLERAYLLEQTRELNPRSFPAELLDLENVPLASISVDTTQTLAAVREAAVRQAEHTYLRRLLTANRGRIDRSAAQAGISVRQLNNLMHKYHLNKEDFKTPSEHADPKTSLVLMDDKEELGIPIHRNSRF